MPRHHAKNANVAGVNRDPARAAKDTSRARDRAERRQARAQVGTKVAFAHALTDPKVGPKQPGRRYGPAPKKLSVGEVQRAEWTSPAPLAPDERSTRYARQNPGRKFTARQKRRMKKAFNAFTLLTEVTP